MLKTIISVLEKIVFLKIIDWLIDLTFGCTGSSLQYRGFSLGGPLVAEHGPQGAWAICSLWALEHQLNSGGTGA